MTTEEWLYFQQKPQVLPLYQALREKLLDMYPQMGIHVTKTQIAFRNCYVFAIASLPLRKRKDWPEQALLVTFGLPKQKESPRIVQAVEAYPNRWTHHVLIEKEEEIDAELLTWIDEAYQFSMIK